MNNEGYEMEENNKGFERLSQLSDNSRRQLYTADQKKSSGCFVSTVKGFILTFFALTIAVLVGVIVHFASPGKTIECKCTFPESPPVSAEQKWQDCLELSKEKNICLSAPHCPGMGGMTTTSAPEVTTEAPTMTPNVRLPLKVMPTHYDLELTPDIYTGNPETFTFSGKVKIHMTCMTATDVITLHINKLEIDGTMELLDSGPGARVPMVKNWSRDEEKQFLLVHLNSMLTVGNSYVLSVEFHGPLKDDLVGLYWSTYKAGTETRYVATTQMQPTDARKTFPCFDEPGIKTTYSTTLVRKKNMKSLSNMNIIRTDPSNKGADWEADVYNKTVKMSTYLLAFIICDFEFQEGITSGGTVFRVWSRPEAINQTSYALEKGLETLQDFEAYFNIPFPLPKQDMIAVPDFAAGAMENWGLIIYRETALLYDTQLSSAGNKQRVAEVVVHELAHQWFGNLVTPVWWDDLWLNEGFASYMEYVGMDKIEPSWDMHDQFVERDLQLVFLIDSLSTSHPIWVPVNHPDEINEIFDRISYLKGASIIRMMNNFLGESTFTSGLTNYLNAYAYGNSNHTDLWAYLGQQANTDNKMIDVPSVMNTWVRQMGYPVVTINVNGDKASLTQEHFLTDPSKAPSEKYPSPYNYKWNIPLSFIQSTEVPAKWTDPHMHWMMTNDNVNQLTNLDVNADWLIGNVGQFGYYRVSYNQENWDALIQQLVNDYTKIQVKNRAQIIDDSINLGRSGYLDQLVGLRTTEYLVSETHYIPWKAASDALTYFSRMLQYTEYFGAFKGYMLKQVMPIYNSMGFDYDQATEAHLDKYKRSLAWTLACRYGLQSCLDQATVSLNQWMQDPDNDTLIKPDMKGVLYCNGIQNGGINEWNFLYQKYKDANVAAEASRILTALACSNEPWILNRYLIYALDPNEIRKQDAISVVSAVSRNIVGRSMVWDFFRERWTEIKEKWGGGFFAISNLISSMTASFNTEFLLSQMQDFRTKNPDLGAGNRAFDQAIESTQSNIKWMTANKEKLGQWLISKT